MPAELLYIDRTTGNRLKRSELPRSDTGLITFLTGDHLSSSSRSVQGWDKIYLQKTSGGSGDDSRKGTYGPPSPLPEKMRNLPYFRHLLKYAGELIKDAPVLEVGCGTAGTSLALAGEFNVVPYGVDISEKAVLEACRKFAFHGLDPLTLSVTDVISLPFADNVFPLIFGKTVFEHFEFPREAAREIFRVTAPGGCVVMDVPNTRKARWTLASERAMGHIHTTNTYTIEEFSSMLEEAGFEILEKWGSWLFYTTPYILLSGLFPGRSKKIKNGVSSRAASGQNRRGNPKGFKPGINRALTLPVLFADRLFKDCQRALNDYFDRRGWTTPYNGVLLGVVARKPA